MKGNGRYKTEVIMTSQNNIHPKNNNQEVTVDIIKIQSDSHKHNYNFF